MKNSITVTVYTTLLLVCVLTTTAAKAQLKVGNNPTEIVADAKLQVDGDNTTITPTKLIVTGTGAVGIGTAAPQVGLHVLNSGAAGASVNTTNMANMALRLEGNGNGQAVIQHLLARDAGGAPKQVVMGINPTFSGGNGLFVLTRGSNDFMMNLATGNLGMGMIPTATEKLSVNGTATVSGNMGIGITPGTQLDVNGAITTRETGVSAATGTAIVPGNTSMAQLTGSPAGDFNVIVSPAPPNPGQRLIVYNNTSSGYSATLNNFIIPNGHAVEFVYSNAAWHATNSGNSWGTTGNTNTLASTDFIGTRNNVDFVTRTNNTERMRVTGAGRLGIGTTAPDQLLTVNGNASKATGGTAWAVFSDSRLKKDIHPFTDGLQQVLQINPVFFKYNGKAGIQTSVTDEIGIIAQDMQQIAPYTITETAIKIDDSGKGVLQFQKSDAIMYMLVNGMKEQQQTIEKQQQIIGQQQNRIADLEQELKQVKAAVDKLINTRQ